MENIDSWASKRTTLQRFLFGTTCLLAMPSAYAQDTSSTGSQPPVTVEEISVTATRFNTTSVSTINKMPEDVVDTSQSIKVLSADELSFAGIQTLSDLGKLDSGEYTTPVSSAYVTQNYFRGFGGLNTCNDFPIKIDGFRTNCEMPPDLAPFASVDVLKGSSSSVYGQSFVAGTLVLNSEMPKKDFGGSESIEYGQFDHKLTKTDIYGSLTQDQSIYGRLIVSYQDEGAGFDGFKQKYLTLAPSLKYDIDGDNTITWVASYTHVDSGAGFGFPLAFNSSGPGGASNGANYSIPNIPLNQLGFLQPPWAEHDGDWFNTSLKYEHTFANDWHFSIAAEHYTADYSNKFVWVGDFSPISANKKSKTDLYIYWETEHDSQWAAEVNLFGDVHVLGHDQTFFFGGDFTQSNLGINPYVGKYISGSATGFNIYQPNWGLLPNPGSVGSFEPGGPYNPSTFAVGYERSEINAGPEFGTLLRPLDDLTINLGARWSTDTEDIQRVCCSLPLASVGDAESEAARPRQTQWTYQGGLNYTIIEGVHAYGSYGTTFEAGNKFGYNPAQPNGIGTFLGPQKGSSTELGFKGQSSDSLINWSVDIFDTRITNSFQVDPNHPQYTISAGAERAQGFEAELQGKISPAWDVTASASSTNNVYTYGELKGFSSPFAVPFGLSVFSDYQLQDGTFKGLGFGGGYVFKTRAPYKLYNGADLSGLIADDKEASLRLFYEVDRFRADLFVNNLTDDRYIAPRLANSPQYDWFVNQPRQIYAKLSVKF